MTVKVDIRVPVGLPVKETADFIADCETTGFSGVGVHDHQHSGRETAFTLEMPVQSIRDVLHDDVDGVTLHLEVMDPGDVGVVKTGGEPGLPLEGLQVLRVIGDRLVDDLYSHDPVQVCIPGTVDCTLPTLAYPLEYLVSAYTLQHGCREL